MLASATGRPVYLIEVPENPENVDGEGYIVMYPVAGAGTSGSMSDPEEDVDYVYQIRSLGRSPRQTRWLQDQVRAGFVGRGAGGFSFAITPASGKNVQSRSTLTMGGIIKDGEELFRSEDTFTVRCGE